MRRSSLSYPLNRGLDADAGGAADLQTDVMRFMAIISLCLVAIFALVQSLPMPDSPPPVPRPALDARPVADEPASAVAVETPDPVPPIETSVQAQEPAAPPVRAPLPPAVPYREAGEASAAAEQQRRPTPPALPKELRAAPADAAPVQDGFTLRFESDLVLTRLVARNEIGLYALRPGKALRMSVDRGAVSFWPASSPREIHEMDETTVPASVVTALRRSGTSGAVRWGVTLPARLSRDLDRYLDEHSGGSLVIGADGDLRLER